jgi:hypothetical protein
MAIKRVDAPKPVETVKVSEGIRQELVLLGRAGDPATGRVLVLDENGNVRYED